MSSFGLANNEDPNSLATRMRNQRFAAFLQYASRCTKDHVCILDVGGTVKFWNSAWSKECERFEVIVLNLKQEQTSGRMPVTSIAGDARDLSEFDSGSFDFCFSNSVIEHVGTLADQTKMAAEVSRVGNGYFIQTPYRYFPIEPHFQFPLWAQLPLSLRTEFHRRFDLGWMPAIPDYLTARLDVEQIRLLTLYEYRALFPDAEIHKEKFGPFIKSIMAVRPYREAN